MLWTNRFGVSEAAYTSQILYVISLCLAKMALLHFLVYLARNNARRMLVRGVMIFNCTSAMVAILCVAFQCPLPHPWEILLDKCFDQVSWNLFEPEHWADILAAGLLDSLRVYGYRSRCCYYSVVNLPIVRSSCGAKPKISYHRCICCKSIVKLPTKIECFVNTDDKSRMIPIIIVRLVFLSAFSNSTDHPFDDFSTVLTTIIHINFSIIVSCVPFLKPVMDSLQTGVLASDLRTRNPVPSSSRLPISLEKISRKIGSGSKKLIESESQGYSATATSSGNDDQQDVLSGSSSKEKMVIQKQTTVAVHYGNPTTKADI